MGEEHKKHYWLHRITGGDNGWVLSYPLLRSHNLLSIGWSFLSYKEYAKKIQEGGRSALNKVLEKEGSRWSRNANSLLRFLYEMKVGDIVLVPQWQSVSLYRIADNEILSNEEIEDSLLAESGVRRDNGNLVTSAGDTIDLGFYRKVEPIVLGVARSELGDVLYNKTCARQTNLNISDAGKIIENLISSRSNQEKAIDKQPIAYPALIGLLQQHITTIDNEQTFVDRVKSVFGKMIEQIKDGVRFDLSPIDDAQQQPVDILYDEVKDAIKENIRKTEEIIGAYLSGDIYSSTQKLDDWWKSVPDNEYPRYQIKRKDIFYRVRLKGEKVYSEKDLFHVPFNKRGLVTTNRYSIPGYPCLYMGRSLYICWEELKRPALSGFATSALQAQEDIDLLDLRLRKVFFNKVECLNFMKMLPVILACSLAVENEQDKFKSEYVLPQLLLHLVVFKNRQKRDAKTLRGIIYTSTVVANEFDFINEETKSSLCLADCIVLPALIQNNTKSQYCADLSKKFLITKPKYYETEYIKDSLAFIRESLAALLQQEDLQNAKQVPSSKYQVSYFSFIEKCLRMAGFVNVNEGFESLREEGEESGVYSE